MIDALSFGLLWTGGAINAAGVLWVGARDGERFSPWSFVWAIALWPFALVGVLVTQENERRGGS